MSIKMIPAEELFEVIKQLNDITGQARSLLNELEQLTSVVIAKT